MRVQRRCHVCGDPIRGEVVYSRSVDTEEATKRVHVHPACFFEEVPEDEQAAYRRELIPEDASEGAPERAERPGEGAIARGGAPGPRQGAAPVFPETATEQVGGPSARQADTVIEARDLAKTYPDGTRAVKGVSFSVRRGEIYGILGPNGAGKTTTIGMLGTLVKPTGGSATVAGVDVREDPEHLKAKLGFAMQEIGVDELASGREFLNLQARLYGIGREEAAERADRLLELFDLEEAAEKRIEGYSGGMKRRVDLAGALIHEPEVIFLDEPTEGLDPRGRREMWQLVERLNRELDATILLSTHYMEEADALCDRLAIMDEGEIVVEGTPESLKATVGEESIVLTYDALGRDEHLDRAQAMLTSDGIVDSVQRSGNELHAYVSDTARSIPAVLRTLEREGVAPESLSVKSATLDDVYLAYTGRSIEAAERAEDADAGEGVLA